MTVPEPVGYVSPHAETAEEHEWIAHDPWLQNYHAAGFTASLASRERLLLVWLRTRLPMPVVERLLKHRDGAPVAHVN